MITLYIFLVFLVLFLYGQVGITNVGSYENRYGAAAFLGVVGMVITGWVAFIMTFSFWSIVVVAAIYLYMKHIHAKVFS